MVSINKPALREPRHKSKQKQKISLTIGYLGYRASYAKNTASPTIPTTSGTITRAEDHGNWTPPHVSAMIREVVEPMTIRFPLCEWGEGLRC